MRYDYNPDQARKLLDEAGYKATRFLAMLNDEGAMATSVEERREQFRWMDKLSDEDVAAVPLAGAA